MSEPELVLRVITDPALTPFIVADPRFPPAFQSEAGSSPDPPPE
ncbi:hypothetical protein [Actinacidiphila acidipaludis]|nr:hypothetical protein [Streptomyces acidipaludis]